MKKHKTAKTNAMRILDKMNVDYDMNTYEIGDKHLNGVEISKIVGANVEEVYKTLVLENASHEHFVFVIPVNANLDLKQAAHVVNEKNYI